MRIYLDMCSIHRPLDDQSQLRIRLEAEAVIGIIAFCESGRASLISSDALEFGVSKNPNPVRASYATDVLAGASEIARLSAAVEEEARKLIEAGVKPLDALHLTFAIETRADYFCTCDDRLLKRARSNVTGPTKVVAPIELVGELGL